MVFLLLSLHNNSHPLQNHLEKNVSKLVTFYNPNKKDMKTIMEEYLGDITKEEEKEILKILKTKQYSNLEISLVFPYGYKINGKE